MCEAACVHSLNSQLLAVTKGEAIISERAQHNGRVHHVFLKAQEPHIQSLKPHQHSVLCKKVRKKKVFVNHPEEEMPVLNFVVSPLGRDISVKSNQIQYYYVSLCEVLHK